MWGVGGGKGGQKVIKERSETTGENKSTEECMIGIRGEGDNRRVDFLFFFYHKNKRLLLSCKKPSL